MKKSIATALSIINTPGFLSAHHVVAAGEPVFSDDYAGQPVTKSEIQPHLTYQAEIARFLALEVAMDSRGCQKIESQSDHSVIPVVQCSSHAAAEGGIEGTGTCFNRSLVVLARRKAA